ncbi:MAG: GNAT family N-acetyltransferase [Pyrinomonadaceae bacterium]
MSELQRAEAEGASTDGARVTFRPVQPGDEPFLLKVYSTTRADELAQVPWDEEQRQAFLNMQFTAQQMHYQSHHPEATHEIILLNERPIGRVYIDRADHPIQILDITLLPEHRNKGIGTLILKDLLAEAASAGRSLTIYVESFNPSLSLFERLGFSRSREEGIYLLMEWRAEEEGKQ